MQTGASAPWGPWARWCAGAWVGLLVAGPALAQPVDEVLAARVEEPRAYGWRVGDVVRRVVHLRIPAGWQLDERSLPKPDQRGGEVELRALSLQPGRAADLVDTAAQPGAAGAPQDQAEPGELGRAVPGAPAGDLRGALVQAGAVVTRGVVGLVTPGAAADQRAAALRGPAATLVLDYQVFSAATTPRRLDLPTLVLLVDPPPGLADATVRELRLPARPLWLAPLAGNNAGSQSGLGELRPDVGVAGLDAGAPARRLVLSLALAAALLLLVLAVAAVLRWQGVTGRARPFALALRGVTRELGRHSRLAGGGPGADARRRAAQLALHQAFHHAAGRALLPRDARGWALADPRFASLADAIGGFFDATAAEFFAPSVTPAAAGPDAAARAAGVTSRMDAAALLALSRALARAERRGLAAQGVHTLAHRAGRGPAATPHGASAEPATPAGAAMETRRG